MYFTIFEGIWNGARRGLSLPVKTHPKRNTLHRMTTCTFGITPSMSILQPQVCKDGHEWSCNCGSWMNTDAQYYLVTVLLISRRIQVNTYQIAYTNNVLSISRVLILLSISIFRISWARGSLLATEWINIGRTQFLLSWDFGLFGRWEDNIWQGMGDAISVEHCVVWNG